MQLAAGKDKLSGIKKAFAKAIDFLHQNKGFAAKDMDNEVVKALTKETYAVLNDAVTSGITYEVSDAVIESLQNNVFIFSGLKTYASLKEASALLLDESKAIKSLDKFKTDIAALDETYNQNYLEAEYQFATHSAQMVSKWKQISDDGDRYHLQYRTAGDDKVRESHKALHNITLPATDAFWDQFYPPNGWRCRCTVVQVRKGKYEVSDSEEAAKAGEAATTALDKDGKNKAAMFRFNPGKRNAVFPANHPYAKVAPAAAKEAITKQAKQK